MRRTLFDEPVSEPAATSVTASTTETHWPRWWPESVGRRDYQLDVLERGRGRLAGGQRRGIIQGATGSGKTVVAAALCRFAQEKKKRVLVLADRRRLIYQLSETLMKFGVRHGVIMAGETHHTQDPVVIACRDTLAAWLRNDVQLPDDFDLIVPDETHRFLAQVYQKLAACYPKAAVVGLSGTPCRNDGQAMGDYFQWIECIAPASQLIREGWLMKPTIYAPLELAAKRKKGTKIKGLAGDPVQHWRKHADGLPTAAFSQTIKSSLELMQRFTDAGIPAEHIDASADDGDREDAFERLRTGRTMILCTVNLLTEGVDLPWLACGIGWKKFGSLIEWLQTGGRLMRPFKGKSKAIFLDHSGAAGAHCEFGTDIRWSLDPSSTVSQRLKQDKKDGKIPKTVYCANCGLAFAGTPECPDCGWRVSKAKSGASKTLALQDEVLSLFTGEAAAAHRLDDRCRFWRQCLGIAANSGKAVKTAAAMFSRKCGLPPWQAHVQPLPANPSDWQKDCAAVFPEFKRRRA